MSRQQKTIRTHAQVAIVAILSCASMVGPTPAEAQFAGFGDPIAQADLLYLAGDPRQALEILDRHLASDSTDYEALWRAARASVVIGIDEEGSRVQNAWLDPAMSYAERAVALRPDGIDGIYWHGVASGRRAMNAAPSYAVDLAQSVYDDANRILAADSLHGGAHNMLGKLNYEIMTISRVKRLIARTFMGNRAISDTSWENAEYHLRRAVESWPDIVLFHFDLAQLYRRRDRRDEAIAAFSRVLELPSVHPTDQKLKAQATEILEEWGVPLPDPADATSPGDPTGR